MNERRNSKDNIIIDENDFSASMARLTELAAKDLGPDKPKEDKTLTVDDELLKEFMKPKRKAKPQGFKEKWAGKTLKLKINPYVASGISIVILSVGIIAAPRISKHFEEQRLAAEAEQKKLTEIAKNTDKKLKSYNVFDAAKDISGGNTELKSSSMKELVKTVEEGNKLAEAKAAEQALQVAMNTLSLEPEAIQINLFENTNSYEFTEGSEASLYDLTNPELYWDTYDIEGSQSILFNSQQLCSGELTDIPSDEVFTADIVNSYFNTSTKACFSK